jgi:hypothetical protein
MGTGFSNRMLALAIALAITAAVAIFAYTELLPREPNPPPCVTPDGHGCLSL